MKWRIRRSASGLWATIHPSGLVMSYNYYWETALAEVCRYIRTEGTK